MKDNGDSLGGMEGGLQTGSGEGNNHIHLFRHEFPGDFLHGLNIPVCIPEEQGDVFPITKSPVFQGLDKTLPDGIEGWCIDDLADTDCVQFLTRPAAADSDKTNHQQQHPSFFHGHFRILS
jgi:hypothetical protein